MTTSTVAAVTSAPTKPVRMPFRARMKKAFGRSSSNSSTPSEEGTTTSGQPIEFYKAGEVPRSKYRGPWNQAHQDKLHAFNFSFGRKASSQGDDFSPAQTRAQSRRSSWISVRRPSTKGSSGAAGAKASDRAPSRVDRVVEAEGDNDIINVGGSRAVTREPTKEKRGANFGKDEDNDSAEIQPATNVMLPEIEVQHDKPFTEEELTRALTAASLQAPKSITVS